MPCDPTNSGNCVIKFGGVERTIASVVLIANGICFGIMTVLFTTIGRFAGKRKNAEELISLQDPSPTMRTGTSGS